MSTIQDSITQTTLFDKSDRPSDLELNRRDMRVKHLLLQSISYTARAMRSLGKEGLGLRLRIFACCVASSTDDEDKYRDAMIDVLTLMQELSRAYEQLRSHTNHVTLDVAFPTWWKISSNRVMLLRAIGIYEKHSNASPDDWRKFEYSPPEEYCVSDAVAYIARQIENPYDITWTEFKSTYEEYATGWAGIQSLLCVGDKVFIGDIIMLAKTAGFPFNVVCTKKQNVELRPRMSIPIIDRGEWMRETRELYSLLEKQSSELQFVTNTLHRIRVYAKRHGSTYATKWALDTLANEHDKSGVYDPLTDDIITTTSVTRGRNHAGMFFSAYMSIWKSAICTLDPFIGSDFPGKEYIRDAIMLLEPLDAAYTFHVLHNESKPEQFWHDNRPPWYDFMRSWLLAMDGDADVPTAKWGGEVCSANV